MVYLRLDECLPKRLIAGFIVFCFFYQDLINPHDAEIITTTHAALKYIITNIGCLYKWIHKLAQMCNWSDSFENQFRMSIIHL